MFTSIRPLSSLLFITVVAGISGCDFWNGVTRQYSLPSPVEYDCVESVLAGHPMIEEYEYTQEDGSRQLTWGGLQEPDQLHRFSYRLSGTEYRTSFYFLARYNGVFEYHHTFGCLNCIPPQEEVDKFRPFMLDLERRLERDCASSGIVEGAEEHCSKVDCGSGV